MPRLRLGATPPTVSGLRTIDRPSRRFGLLAACLISGVALSLAFPEADLYPLAWIAIAPLLIGARGGSIRRGAVLGAVFGLGFFGSLLAWVSLVGWVAWAALVVAQAAFLGLFGAVWAWLTAPAIHATARATVARVTLAPTLWVAVEFFRSRFPLEGFPWGQLAQSQHVPVWMLKPSALAGAWAVSFVVVLVNALVAEGWTTRAVRHRLAAVVGAAASVALPAVLPGPPAPGAPVRAAIVQGNVPRSFSGTGFEKNLAILRSHAELTRSIEPGGVDLVVWPESAIGIDLERVPEVRSIVRGAARAAGAPMVVGGDLDVDDERRMVMAFLVSGDGDVVDRYQKTHLVPFGEYVPWRRWIGWIPMLDQVPRDAVPGDERVVFDVAGGAVAPVISFEGDFGSLVREGMAEGGRLLVVATNTSTWGESWASAQHLAFSRVRAVENGVWVAHAAISGISAFVAPDGRVAESTALWTEDVITARLHFASATTFYARTGDWLAVGCSAVAAAALLAALVGAGRRRYPEGHAATARARGRADLQRARQHRDRYR